MSFGLNIDRADGRSLTEFVKSIRSDKALVDWEVEYHNESASFSIKVPFGFITVLRVEEVYREEIRLELGFDPTMRIHVPHVLFGSDEGKIFIRQFVNYLVKGNSQDIMVWYDFGQAVLYRKNGIVQLSSKLGVIPNLFDPDDFDSVQIVENLDIV